MKSIFLVLCLLITSRGLAACPTPCTSAQSINPNKFNYQMAYGMYLNAKEPSQTEIVGDWLVVGAARWIDAYDIIADSFDLNGLGYDQASRWYFKFDLVPQFDGSTQLSATLKNWEGLGHDRGPYVACNNQETGAIRFLDARTGVKSDSQGNWSNYKINYEINCRISKINKKRMICAVTAHDFQNKYDDKVVGFYALKHH